MEKLVSLRKSDFVVETFRSGGKGGQNQNKVSSGVRITHPPSGAVGVARDSRDQLQNKRNAFLRMANSPKFQAWLRKANATAAAGKDGERKIKEQVERELQPDRIRVECKDSSGRWTLFEAIPRKGDHEQ